MNNYVDINNNWSFTSTGDLLLNTDYIQSLRNRLTCSLEHLKIYYSNYGSNLNNLLGEYYDRDEVLFVLNSALSEDKNITDYEINNVNFEKNHLTIYLTIDGVEIVIEIDMEELL